MERDQTQASPVPETHAVDRSRRIKVRIGRSLAPLAIATIALCAVVVWHRNATHVTKACDRIEPAVARLNQYIEQNNMLPLIYPPAAGIGEVSGDRGFEYVGEDVIRWARSADEPVLVGYGPSAGLVFQPNGRPVAIYERGRVRVEWMTGRDVGPILERQKRLAGRTPADTP